LFIILKKFVKKKLFLIFSKIYLFSVIILILSASSEVFSQQDSTKIIKDTIQNPKRDTICYKIKFTSGDTLVYYHLAWDSIVVDYGTPLRKVRNEIIKIICDSVSNRGTFFVSQIMTDFTGYESVGEDTNKVERKETNWLNRKISFEIDSTGKKYSSGVSDTVNPGINTGGAFQPVFFFCFGSECRITDVIWIEESKEALIENAYPPAFLNQMTLFKAVPDVDTLNEKCTRMEYIKTGQGKYKYFEGKQQITVNSIINEHGNVDISKEKLIPIHYYQTIEQKLTINTADGVQKPAFHYINSFYTLKEIRKYVARNKNFGKELNTKNKKKIK
jgi:hypothetical protein